MMPLRGQWQQHRRRCRHRCRLGRHPSLIAGTPATHHRLPRPSRGRRQGTALVCLATLAAATASGTPFRVGRHPFQAPLRVAAPLLVPHGRGRPTANGSTQSRTRTGVQLRLLGRLQAGLEVVRVPRSARGAPTQAARAAAAPMRSEPPTPVTLLRRPQPQTHTSQVPTTRATPMTDPWGASRRGNANKHPASAALRPLVLAVRFVEVLSHASAQRASTAGQDTSRKKH